MKNYLAAFNLIAFVFWLLYLIHFTVSGFQITATGLLLLNIAQGLAMLEIVHALLKWVKSPLVTTAAQVASRIFVLVLINWFILHGPLLAVTKLGFTLVSVAWSITELVRYSFYFLSLRNSEPTWLVWMRYSFFIVLYPMGVTGEWCIISTPIFETGLVLNLYNVACIFIAIAYLYYFPILYGYMWRQRKARL